MRKQEAGGQTWTVPVDMKEAAKTFKELKELTILGCPLGMSEPCLNGEDVSL